MEFAIAFENGGIMTTKRFLVCILLALAGASVNTALAAERLLARVHGAVVAPSGARTHFTELTFVGDVRAIITLWKGNDGHHYIFRNAENYLRRQGAISFSDLDTKRYLKVSWNLPVTGSTPAEVAEATKKLTAATYALPQITVETSSLKMTVPVTPSMNGDLRSALRRDLPPAFIKALVDISVRASTAASPAARPACEMLASLLVDDAVCNARGVEAVPVDDDCTFDAEFGYPCD
jgi:hypothetical protein